MTAPYIARILVVDDNEHNRELMTRILEREGHTVDTAEDGAIALQKLGSEVYDLVLLDVMMPEVDGFQVIETMQRNDRMMRVPVIMLSALHEQESVLKCIQFGAEDYLPKPVNQQLLKARINSCLEKKRLHDMEQEYTRRVESISGQLQVANERLRRVNQLKSQFLATAAHDLKNPLSGIMLLVDRIRSQAEEGGPCEPIVHQAARVHTVIERMVHIINGLLDTSVQEMGEVVPCFEVTNLSDLVHGVVRDNEPYAISKDIRLHYRETLAAECWGAVDRLRLGQAIDNLVNNAIKYSPLGRQVWIEVTLRVVEGKDRVHIEVRDQGPGLTSEDLLQAFGPYQRLSALPTGGEYSTGLGLSIVKQMVEMHHGWVWIESEPGQGATFLVEVPLEGGALEGDA